MSKAIERCNCEHTRHFPLGEAPEFPDVPRNGHPYRAAYAGETHNRWVGAICDACAMTCLGEAPNVPFDRAAYAASHGWTLAQLEEFEATYSVDAETLAIRRMHEREEFRTLAPWQRTPETHMGG